MTLPTLDDDDVKFNDPPKLVWMRVRDAKRFLSPRNPKMHDLGAIIKAIAQYGYQELPKYDAKAGWIKAGNGRIEALIAMEKGKEPLPRGLAQDKNGGWVMPLLIGTDAKDENQALAYLIDANNLTMAGGDTTLYDMAKMWDLGLYNSVLQDLADDDLYTVTVDPEGVDAIFRLEETRMEPPKGNGNREIVCPHCGERITI